MAAVLERSFFVDAIRLKLSQVSDAKSLKNDAGGVR